PARTAHSRRSFSVNALNAQDKYPEMIPGLKPWRSSSRYRPSGFSQGQALESGTGRDFLTASYSRYASITARRATPLFNFLIGRVPPCCRSDAVGITKRSAQKIPSFSSSFTTTLTTASIAFFAELGLNESLMPVQTNSPSGVADAYRLVSMRTVWSSRR